MMWNRVVAVWETSHSSGHHTKVKYKAESSGGPNSASLCHSSLLGPLWPLPITPWVPIFTPSPECPSSGITDSQICLNTEAGMCWHDKSLLEICPVQQLPRAVWQRMIGFAPWWQMRTGQVLPWDPSQAENLPLHTLNPHAVSNLLTCWRYFSDWWQDPVLRGFYVKQKISQASIW